MSTAIQISRPVGIAVALLSLWLLDALSFAVMLKATGPWFFLPTNDFQHMMLVIGAFYAARAAALMIAICAATLVVAHSRFVHPYRMLAGMIGAFHLVSLIVRWKFKPPAWQSVSESAPALALAFELTSVLLLVGAGVLLLHLYYKLSRHSHELHTNG